MKRRDFLRMGSAAFAASQMPMAPGASGNETSKADYTLRIAPVTVELAPDHILSTTGYNDSSPGPILRMREGKPISQVMGANYETMLKK